MPKVKKVEVTEVSTTNSPIEVVVKKEVIAPLEFNHGLHVSREEFNEVVAKLNEIIRKN